MLELDANEYEKRTQLAEQKFKVSFKSSFEINKDIIVNY